MVKATNPDKTKDEFYFNYTGYQRPAGDLGNNRFWSSSVSSDSSGYAYLFNGIYGFVAYELRDFNFAVRCVRRQ